MNLVLLILPIVSYSVMVCESQLALAGPTSRLEIEIKGEGGKRLPCRVHLFDQQGNAQKVEGQPFWHDHFVCSGHVVASLAPGKYQYAIERGPEYQSKTGHIEVIADEDQTLHVKLERDRKPARGRLVRGRPACAPPYCRL